MLKLFARKANNGPSNAWVPEDSRVYAVGDIHGRLDLLEDLHDAILADAETCAVPRKVIVYLGDYIDRGPTPEGVIDCLINSALPGFERVHLIGNHEAFMLQFLTDEGAMKSWLMNGGDSTLRSYGIEPYAAHITEERPKWIRGELESRLPKAHKRFLSELKVSHEEGDYLFVHAGVRPGIEIDDQDPYDMIWIREPFLSAKEDFGKIVVHGHTPTGKPTCRSNRIGIDTGAVFGGVLTALVLEGEDWRFIQV